MKSNKLIDWKIICAGIWLFFTFSLTTWWIILGLKNIEGHRSMIIFEGITLIFCVVAGGITLLYLILSERRQKLHIQEFFAVFNHELKTYMASLRLKAEGLAEDLAGSTESADALGIVQDTVRLELQLENSLFLSNLNPNSLFYQDLQLKEIIQSIEVNWPMLNIEYPDHVCLKVDKRAFETILKNIFQNAIVHGKAKTVFISTEIKNKMVLLTISNDGHKFKGNLNRLGELFHRHGETSRSGIGLYLVKKLSSLIKGSTIFNIDANNNLVISLSIQEGSK